MPSWMSMLIKSGGGIVPAMLYSCPHKAMVSPSIGSPNVETSASPSRRTCAEPAMQIILSIHKFRPFFSIQKKKTRSHRSALHSPHLALHFCKAYSMPSLSRERWSITFVPFPTTDEIEIVFPSSACACLHRLSPIPVERLSSLPMYISPRC